MNNWCAQTAFENAINKCHTASKTSPVLRLYEENDYIPLEEWENALKKTACFVERWGIAYLPLFERVEQELIKSRERLSALEKAKRIANGDALIPDTNLRQQSYLIEP